MLRQDGYTRTGAPGARRRRRCRRLWRGAVVLAAAVATILGLSVPAATAATKQRWRAVEVRSPSGGSYGILSGVACTRPASCVAGGNFYSAAHSTQAMIVAELSGTWARARVLRLPANARPLGEGASVASMACPARNSCVAVGFYTAAAGLQAFTTAGHGSSWARARMPGLPKNSAVSEVAYLSGVSCTSPESCVAVGGYDNAAGHGEAMVVADSGGRWRYATGIRLPSNAAASPAAHLSAVSCPKAGECVAVGAYQTKSSQGEGLAVAETRGRWGQATEIRLPGNVTAQPQAELYSVSCATHRSCVAVGSYVTRFGIFAALAVTGSGSHWRRATVLTALPSNAAKGSAAYADLNAVSCTATSCVAVGDYADTHGGRLAMAISQSGRTWGRATEIAPPAHAATGSAQQAYLFAVTCVTSVLCAAVGDYTGNSHVSQAMAAFRG
jgi:hypothetical protein